MTTFPSEWEVRTSPGTLGATFKFVCTTRVVSDPSWYSFEDEQSVRDKWWEIKEGDVVVDAGSAYGSYALPALALGASRVFCWSPEYNEYDLLMASAEANGWSRKIVVRRDGLWSKHGAIIPYSHERPTAFFESMKEAAEEAAVYVRTKDEPMPMAFPVSTLDTVVLHEHHMTRVDWIKLDVEGAEIEVLKGSEEILRKFRPKLLVENHLFKDAAIKDKIAAHIFGLGLGYKEVGTVPYHSISHSLYVADVAEPHANISAVQSSLNTTSNTNSGPRLKLAFVLDSWFVPIPIDPLNLLESERGLTGSENSFFGYAREMERRGHDVTVYTRTEREGLAFGKIPSFSTERFTEEHFKRDWNAVLAWMHPGPLTLVKPTIYRILNQQVNDFGYCPGWEGHVDLVTSPSQTHLDFLSKQTHFTNWKVLPNGVDESFLSKTTEPRPQEILYASSPDRGLHLLLEIFPEIKRRVPAATLTVYYRWDTMYAHLKDHPPDASVLGEISCRVRYIHEAMTRLAPLGVRHGKSVSRSEIAKLLSNARVLAYPCSTTSFTEGFSVTTLEAAVAGCVPVILGADALGEIYGNYVPVVAPPLSEHREEYIAHVVKLLVDDEAHAKAREKAAGLFQVYNWTALGDRLEKILVAGK